MPRKWAPATRELITDGLKDRDGPGCRECFAEPDAPLEIDHVDPSGPTTWPNLRLLCKNCNLKRRRRPKDRGTNESVEIKERQLALGEKLSATDQARLTLPYSEGSPEMQANGYYERYYRAWLLKSLSMAKKEAVEGGAETVGCSVETAGRYLAKLTSGAGPVRVVPDAHGIPMLTLKEANP